ncbi:MAG: excinuclease ABC subunit UvrA [Lachnospiraceae bacterium]|nr:excinuclease ABC subunit UvrA [Lachnospiraceae bacterium]MDE6252901.1 excinuclease ABC subunit UvrA [Lachnospiraceae bacterium]
MDTNIKIRGAYENNLKDIDLDIPKNKLVVITGLSGSGKSSIAFDTLQKECQRQYMDSMGLVTDNLQKPKYRSISGLSPSISVAQRLTNWNTRSTVGTATEIFTYLRILYAKLGKRPCPHCNTILEPVFDEVAEDTLEEQDESEKVIRCPNCNGIVEQINMDYFSFNTPQGACSQCMGLGVVNSVNMDMLINQDLSLLNGAVSIWNSGEAKRNVRTLQNAKEYFGFDYDPEKPVKQYNSMQKALLFYGNNHPDFRKHFPNIEMPKSVDNGRFEGIVNLMMRRYHERASDAKYMKKIEKYYIQQVCPYCHGTRLKLESRQVTIAGKSVVDISEMSLSKLLDWIESLPNHVSEQGMHIAEPIINDLTVRINRLLEVGLGYLSLERSSPSLSAGEAQRLRLASLLGSGLTGVLYILDEPTIGLHQRDSQRLIKVLKKLRDLGNTVLLVEHDVEVMKAADYIIEIGPGAGMNGGNVVAQGTPEEIVKCPDSITGKYIADNNLISKVNQHRKGNGKSITILGATEHNLRNINVNIPLGVFVAVTGVSGSGKSSLILDILDKALRKKMYGAEEIVGKYQEILGLENIDKLISIDQSPIGKTPRSNAATYTDLYTHIRKKYSSLPKAKEYGFTDSHFSFNVDGGRCPKCEGAGVISIPMHFLPDVDVDCPNCHGKRFKGKILNVRYKGFNIADILNMTIAQAIEVFNEDTAIKKRLKLLQDVGLGYLKLGQPATTLSGGEAQRIKLSKELSKSSKGHTIYILDEPTTGLHPQDIMMLINVLEKLADKGNTVIVIEHNLDVIKRADCIIDIGPEGGEAGGLLVAQGSPEQVCHINESITGQYLKQLLY